MNYDVLQPIGVVINDLNVDDITAGSVTEVRRLLADRGVAVLRKQDIDDVAFLAFLRRFGALTFSVGATPVDGLPDLT